MAKPKITEAEVSAFLAYAKGHNVPDGYDDLSEPEKTAVERQFVRGALIAAAVARKATRP